MAKSKTSFYVLQLKYYGNVRNAWYFFPWSILFLILGILMSAWIIPTYMNPASGSAGEKNALIAVKVIMYAAPYFFSLIFLGVGFLQMRGMKRKKIALEKGRTMFGPKNVDTYSQTLTQDGWAMYTRHILAFTFSDEKTFNVSVKECLDRKTLEKIARYKGDLPLKVYESDVVLDEETLDKIIDGKYDFSEHYKDIFLPYKEKYKQSLDEFKEIRSKVEALQKDSVTLEEKDEAYAKRGLLNIAQGDFTAFGEIYGDILELQKNPNYKDSNRVKILSAAGEYYSTKLMVDRNVYEKKDYKKCIRTFVEEAKNYNRYAFNMLERIFKFEKPFADDNLNKEYFAFFAAANKVLERGNAYGYDLSIYGKGYNVKSFQDVADAAEIYHILAKKEEQRKLLKAFANSHGSQEAYIMKSYYEVRDKINRNISKGIYKEEDFKKLEMSNMVNYAIQKIINNAFEYIRYYLVCNGSKMSDIQ